LGKTLDDKTLDAGPPHAEFSAADLKTLLRQSLELGTKREAGQHEIGKTLDTGASNVLDDACREDRDAGLYAAAMAAPAPAALGQAPPSAALLRTRVFIFHLQFLVVDAVFAQLRGPARAVMGCLQRWQWAMGLLDGLATLIRIRLSSRACEGAWAGPNAMFVGVVFTGGPAGTIGPRNGPLAHRASS
jgi:hypothetical protein